jgi:hypothetical protein
MMKIYEHLIVTILNIYLKMNMVLHFVIVKDFGMSYKNSYVEIKPNLSYNLSILSLAINQYEK